MLVQCGFVGVSLSDQPLHLFKSIFLEFSLLFLHISLPGGLKDILLLQKVNFKELLLLLHPLRILFLHFLDGEFFLVKIMIQLSDRQLQILVHT